METSPKPAICYETGLDEAFLVGTREEIARLAKVLVDAVKASHPPNDYLGIEAEMVAIPLTEVVAEVVLDCIVIVKTTQDRRELMNRILENNGEKPIDWAGRAALMGWESG